MYFLLTESDKVSSLVSIAIEYGDSDSEIECNTDEIKCDNNQPLKEVQMQTYRQNKEVSSSEESDNEDSASSSDSSEIESIESDSDDILSKYVICLNFYTDKFYIKY